MKTFKKNYTNTPPEKLIEEVKNGNLQITTKGIRDWIKFIMFAIMIVLQGAGIYCAIKLEIQNLSINQEYLKSKNIEQDIQIKEMQKDLNDFYRNHK